MTHSDNLTDSLPVTVRYTGNVSGQVTLYRVYSIESFGMQGLLHTVTPTAALSYVPKVDSGPLFGRPHPLDPSVALVNLGLGNTFQAKVDTNRTKRDLGSINLTSSYDMLNKNPNPLKRLSPLIGTALSAAPAGPKLEPVHQCDGWL